MPSTYGPGELQEGWGGARKYIPRLMMWPLFYSPSQGQCKNPSTSSSHTSTATLYSGDRIKQRSGRHGWLLLFFVGGLFVLMLIGAIVLAVIVNSTYFLSLQWL